MKKSQNNSSNSYSNNKNKVKNGTNSNGFIPNSLKFISSCIKTVSSNVRSAGASIASSSSDDHRKDQGYALLAVQAHFRQLRSFPCKDVPLSQVNQCESANKGQLAILYARLYLVAIGTSGVKAAAPPLGADQYDEKDPKEAAKLSSYFNWLMFFLTTGALFGVTFVVWIKLESRMGLVFCCLQYCSRIGNSVPNIGKIIVQKQCDKWKYP